MQKAALDRSRLKRFPVGNLQVPLHLLGSRQEGETQHLGVQEGDFPATLLNYTLDAHYTKFLYGPSVMQEPGVLSASRYTPRVLLKPRGLFLSKNYPTVFYKFCTIIKKPKELGCFYFALT